MKKILNKRLNIIEIILLLSPIIDILTSISQRTFNLDISLGLITRSFLLFFMSIFMLVKSSYKYKRITIIYFGLILVYFAIFIVSTYLTKGYGYIISETKELIKAFYFPICIIAILNYLETKENKIDEKVLFIVLLEYILLLFIPSILNIGYESYAEDKIGTIGWFYSANEISAIYSILIVLVIYSYKYIKNIAVYLAVIVCSFYTILQIGTKLPAATAAISIVGYTLLKFIQYVITKERKHLKPMCTGIVACVIFVFIFINSPVLKNFDIYKNYLIKTRETQLVEAKPVEENIQISENDNVLDNETETKLSSVEKNAEEIKEEASEQKLPGDYQDKIAQDVEDETLTEDEIATIIHSGRAETKEKVQKSFKDLSISKRLIGLGQKNSEDNSYYLIEIDYYDILFNYGYIGFAIYFIPIIVMILYICKSAFSKGIKGIKQIICDDYKCCFIIVIINGLLCAVAGHTFVAPAVSIYISIALIQLYKEFE